MRWPKKQQQREREGGGASAPPQQQRLRSFGLPLGFRRVGELRKLRFGVP